MQTAPSADNAALPVSRAFMLLLWEFVERRGSHIAPAVGVLLPARLAASGARRGEDMIRAARSTSFAMVLITPLLLHHVAEGHGLLASKPGVAVAASHSGTVNTDTTVIARLREGGLVLLCRHAITDRSKPDARTVDFDDRSTQRNLSAEGETQARQIGEEIRRLGIPIGDVRTSPFFRTRESAELSFGHATIDPALEFNGDDNAMRRLLSTPPDPGTNSVFMSHAGRIARVLDMRALGGLEEGDCAVIEPRGDSFDVVGRIRAGEWRTYD